MPTKRNNRISIKFHEIEYRGWKTVYATVLVGNTIKNDSQISDLFLDLYKQLKVKGVQVLQEKVYGLLSKKKKIIAIRNKQIRKASIDNIPYTFIEGAPCVGGVIAGIQIIGVIPKKRINVRTINYGGEPIGRIFKTEDFKEIFLAGINGLDKKNRNKRKNQTKQMFNKCRNILQSQGFKMNDIIRTYIYIPRILNWYNEFNEIRTKCFKDFGLLSKNKVYLPASTGIQGRRNKGEEIFMDVYGLSPKRSSKVKIFKMKNSHQNEAKVYGSLFSRGMGVKYGNKEILHISGTASINKAGESICINDMQGQINKTLINIKSLLKSRKARFKDIVMVTVYCKNKKTYKIFKKFTKNNSNIGNINFIPVYADICREELLFEIDAIAVKI